MGILEHYSLEDIQIHKQEIIDLSYKMGIMHDIGKYYCIPVITINYRKLEEAEFQTIKQHPFCGYRLAKIQFQIQFVMLCCIIIYGIIKREAIR